ncbi:MAG: hypothetical protein R3E95_11730 [Thiolinea sp.]
MADRFWQGDLEASWAEMASDWPEALRDEVYNKPEGVTVYSPVIDELVDEGYLDADRQMASQGFPHGQRQGIRCAGIARARL